MKPGDQVQARPDTITRIVDGFVDHVWTVEAVHADVPRPFAFLVDDDGNHGWEWVDGLEVTSQ